MRKIMNLRALKQVILLDLRARRAGEASMAHGLKPRD